MYVSAPDNYLLLLHRFATLHKVLYVPDACHWIGHLSAVALTKQPLKHSYVFQNLGSAVRIVICVSSYTHLSP